MSPTYGQDQTDRSLTDRNDVVGMDEKTIQVLTTSRTSNNAEITGAHFSE